MSTPWKAPYRPKHEITQSFSDGVVCIYGPGATEPKARLRFAELRLGYRRAYEARLAKSEVTRVIRVPRPACPLRAQDRAVILGDGGAYRVDLAQYCTDVFPPCVDLTLCEEGLAGAAVQPHTVTVFNAREDPRTLQLTIAVTVIPGVLIEGSAGAKDEPGGLRPSGKAVLRIPRDAIAVDAVTGIERSFVLPRAYALAEDRSGIWTLDPNKDYFAKGAVSEAMDFQALSAARDEVWRCTDLQVHDSDGEALWYIEAGGA